MLLYIVGHKGWIGQMFVSYCVDNDIPVTYSDYRGESDELLRDIVEKEATHVFCSMGRTHGTTSDGKTYTTIDYLQNAETFQQNLNDNLYVPLRLSDFCEKHNIHYSYLGTGCIYNYDTNNHPDPFTEEDTPNFFGSNYSIVKGYTNNLMCKRPRALHFRIRMPITSEPNPRNFITKITSYAKICSIPNSMSVLDELIPIAVCMMKDEYIGTYNFTNPGVIDHNEILQMYRDIVDKDFKWSNFSIDEQDTVLLSKRSNNYLDTTKLTHAVIQLRQKYPHLVLNTINDAVRNALLSYRK
jgi:nucleoside-diphosphate-sugar epimerase